MSTGLKDVSYHEDTMKRTAKTNPVRDAYPKGRCPDCGADIPQNADEGDECENCGHVFYSEKEKQGI